MKTKTEEIALLRECAAKLGPNSYCGPWLLEVSYEVEREIRSDFPPSPSISRAQAECEAMLAMARDEAKALRESARAEANKQRKTGLDFACGLRERAANDLRQYAKQLMA